MTEELANTLTWAAFCAFCVVAVALILDAVSELLRSETPEKSARRRAGKIVRSANRIWRRANRQLKNRQRLKTIKSWNL